MATRAVVRFAVVPVVPDSFLAGLLSVEPLQLQTGPEAGRAPAVFGVVGKHARIGLGKAGAAGRAGALDGKILLRERGSQIGTDAFQRPDDAHHALAVFQRGSHRLAQRGLVARADGEVGHGQLDRVLLEAVEPGPGRGRNKSTVHAQVGMTLARCPFSEIRVVAFARGHQRREDADMVAGVLAQQARHDLVGGLRLHADLALRAHLGTQLHVEQPQEVMNFRHRRDGRLASPAAGALLDRHGRRNTEDRVDVRFARGLHDWR